MAKAAGDDTWKRDRACCPAHRSVPWAATPQQVELSAKQAASFWRLRAIPDEWSMEVK